MRKIILAAAALLASACASTKDVILSHDLPIEVKEVAAKGEKQYIVFDPVNFYRPPNQISSLAARRTQVAAALGGKFVREIENSNAVVIRMDGTKRPRPIKGLVIVEDKVYHTMETLYRLTPVTCGTTPPPTTPPPANPPPPGNADDVITNTTWGQKLVRAAEASLLTSARSIKVCDIDTGLDKSVHSQFPSGTIKEGHSMVPNEPWDSDPGKHGTHTAGTIASTMYGVARVALYPCKALSNSGSGMGSWLSGCINKCRAWGAKIINASWGMDNGTDPAIASAVSGFVASGGIFVAAAGNSGGGPIGFPASMSDAVAVTSMDEAGRISNFSSRGSKTGRMYIAPGSNIKSLCPNGTCTMSGTSMATPHVTAIFAIAVSKGKSDIGFVNRNLPVTEQGRGLADALLSAQ